MFCWCSAWRKVFFWAAAQLHINEILQQVRWQSCHPVALFLVLLLMGTAQYTFQLITVSMASSAPFAINKKKFGCCVVFERINQVLVIKTSETFPWTRPFPRPICRHWIRVNDSDIKGWVVVPSTPVLQL